jgi:mRNA-degrading endonuclease RelE of RelBE toxin-antitoxin system
VTPGAAAEFITGPLFEDPRRVGKPLGVKLVGIYSARLGRDWRVLYEIHDAKHVVIVLDIRHRSTAYRRQARERLGKGLQAIEADKIAESDRISQRNQ